MSALAGLRVVELAHERIASYGSRFVRAGSGNVR
jgi:hypothetical protein